MEKELEKKLEELIELMNKDKKKEFKEKKQELKKEISERLDKSECYMFVTNEDFMGAGSTSEMFAMIFSALESLIETHKIPNSIVRGYFERLYDKNKNDEIDTDDMLEFLKDIFK